MAVTEQQMREDLRRRLASNAPAPTDLGELPTMRVAGDPNAGVDVPLSRQVPGFIEVVPPASTRRGRNAPRNPRGAARPAPLTETEQRAELASRLARSQLPEARTALDQGGRTAAGGFVAGMLSLPHAAGELLSSGSAFIEGTIASAIPGGRGFEFGERRLEAEGQFPANMLLMFPNPSAQDVLETVETARQLPGELAATPGSPIRAFGRAAETAEAFEAAQREASPVATTAGEVTADIAALLTLRPKMKSFTGQAGERLKSVPGRIRNFFRGPAAKADPADARTANEAVEQLAEATNMGTRLRQIPGRTAEAAFEGAVIGALGEGDPTETAMWAAGTQAGGSAAMAGRAWIMKNPIGAVGTLWLGHEIWRAVGPGPQNALESKDEAVRALVFTYGSAVVAGVLGSHRGIGRDKVLAVTDALGTASRAAVASLVEELDLAVRNDNPEVPQVIGVLMNNPDALGTEARIRIERAAASEEVGAVTSAIDSLMRNGGFRSRFENAVEDLQEETHFANGAAEQAAAGQQ